MCGIIHVKRQIGVPANKMVIKRYNKQKARGSEGFGFVELECGIVQGVKRAETEKEILEMLEKSTAEEILFHHRTPTSTPNFVEATHPIVVKNKNLKYHYYVVHNGIIFNDKVLKLKHNTDGYNYTTEIEQQWITKGQTYKSNAFNDSEALAIDFVRSLESGEKMTARGSIAMIALQVEKKSKKAVALFFGRNEQNPLKMEANKDYLGISSESGKELKTNTLYRFDYVNSELTDEYKEIGMSYASYDDEDYPAYGHWDNDTGRWVNTGYKGGMYSSGYDDYGNGYDDDEYNGEYIVGIKDMIADTQERLRNARKTDNYDMVIELEKELEDLEVEYFDLVKAEQDQDLRVRRLGF